jgi:hypothetical protein
LDAGHQGDRSVSFASHKNSHFRLKILTVGLPRHHGRFGSKESYWKPFSRICNQQTPLFHQSTSSLTVQTMPHKSQGSKFTKATGECVFLSYNYFLKYFLKLFLFKKILNWFFYVFMILKILKNYYFNIFLN